MRALKEERQTASNREKDTKTKIWYSSVNLTQTDWTDTQTQTDVLTDKLAQIKGKRYSLYSNVVAQTPASVSIYMYIPTASSLLALCLLVTASPDGWMDGWMDGRTDGWMDWSLAPSPARSRLFAGGVAEKRRPLRRRGFFRVRRG